MSAWGRWVQLNYQEIVKHWVPYIKIFLGRMQRYRSICSEGNAIKEIRFCIVSAFSYLNALNNLLYKATVLNNMKLNICNTMRNEHA